MKYSLAWLQSLCTTPLPEREEIRDKLIRHSFEVESVEEHGEDTIFDIKILPDRAHDCLSHYGLAQELQRLFPNIALAPLRESVLPASESIQVRNDEPLLAARCMYAHIEKISLRETPPHIASCLSVLGHKSISPIVDIANYAMLTYGQPLHVYDASVVARPEGVFSLRVRRGKGEVVNLLGGEKKVSTTDTLVIADGVDDEVLALAGIKGSQRAEVKESTQSILVESAHFNAPFTRLSARRLGLRTEASLRFEQGITPELASRGLHAFISLLKEYDPHSVVSAVVDYYPRRASPYRLGISEREVSQVTGISLSPQEIIAVLHRSGITAEYCDPREVFLTKAREVIGVPYVRGASVTYDAPRAFDCSSLVAYCASCAGVSVPRMSIDQYVFSAPIEKEELQVGDLIFSNTGEGRIYTESIEWQKGTSVPQGVDHVGIYIGEGKVLHAQLGRGVVSEDISSSERFKNCVGYGRIFDSHKRIVATIPDERLDLRMGADLVEEIVRLYGYEHCTSVSLPKRDSTYVHDEVLSLVSFVRATLISRGYSEVCTYAMKNSGQVEIKNPLAQDKRFLRDNLADGLREARDKAVRNAPLLSLTRVALFECGVIHNEQGERYQCAILFQPLPKAHTSVIEEEISCIKALCAPFVPEHAWKKEGDVYVIECEQCTPAPYTYLSMKLGLFRGISPFPFIVRDVSVFVPSHEMGKSLFHDVLNLSLPDAKKISIIDSFEKKDDTGASKISYTYRVVFQSENGTLTDEEANRSLEPVLSLIQSKGYILR